MLSLIQGRDTVPNEIAHTIANYARLVSYVGGSVALLSSKILGIRLAQLALFANSYDLSGLKLCCRNPTLS